jgi:hypothetical protein
MRTFLICTALLLALMPATSNAQRHELGLTLGALSGPGRSAPGGNLDLSSGVALQANYGYRFLNRQKAQLFGEIHFLANGQRTIGSTNATATRDVATAYVTPGFRVKFAPASRLAPYVAVGGGYALYEQSYFQISGASNQAPRFTHRGAFMFGGGADYRLWKWLGLRGEIRDFYTGNPSFNTAVNSSGQHNVVAGGGLVVFFGGNE